MRRPGPGKTRTVPTRSAPLTQGRFCRRLPAARSTAAAPEQGGGMNAVNTNSLSVCRDCPINQTDMDQLVRLRNAVYDRFYRGIAGRGAEV